MRRLAWTMAGLSVAIFLAHYLIPASFLRWAALAMLVLFPLCWLLPLQPRRRARLLIAGAAVGLLCYGFAVHTCVAPLSALPEDACTVSARVTEYPVRYDYSTGITLRLEDPKLTRLLVQAYSYDDSCDNLRPGDLIRVTLKLRPATTRFGEETDTYLSRGIGALGTVTDKPERIGHWNGSWIYFPKHLAHWLRQMTAKIFPADVSAFAEALMLGEKRALYAENLDIPLKNAGIMHIAAVSGLHIGFLFTILRLQFGRHRMWSLLALPLMGIFAVMAGCTPSVLRSVLMFSLLLLAPVLGRENDIPTTLLTALGVLLLINPFSVGSVSLQLSFASMAGLCLLMPGISEWFRARLPARKSLPKPIAKLLSYFVTTISATLSAMVFTLPLSAIHFGTLQLAAPLTNLLVMWLLPWVFLACFAAVLLGLIWLPLGMIAAGVTAWPIRLVLLCAKAIAGIPGLLYSVQNPLIAAWMIFLYLLFLLTWLASPRGGYRPVLPVCVGVMTLCLVTMLTRFGADGSARATAIDVGQGQCLLFRDGNASVMVDCGGNHTVTNAGDLAAQTLLAEGRTSLDALILTHPHQDHVNGAERLLLQIRVDTLILPAAADAESDPIRSIIGTAEARGTEVIRLETDTDLTLDPLRVSLFVGLGAGYEDGCMMLRLSDGDFDALITGDVTTEVEQMLAASYDLTGTELYIAGHHGSRHASGDVLLDELGATGAIISCGYNSYGHPTPEAMARMSEHGIKIYRTDQLGSVTVRME